MIEPLALQAGEVHVWQANLDSQETESPIRLPVEECERAAQMPSGRLRERYLRSRVLLRAVLASYLGLAPGTLLFDTGARGKPHLLSFSRDRGPSRLAFNLSHARACWVLAVAPHGPLGIDVEDTSRRVDVDGVGRRIFSPRELQTLRRLPAAVRKEAFFRCWTAREAIAKARGEGVFTRGAQFDVVADPALPPGVHERESCRTSGAGWVLTPIPVPAGFTCLLATDGTPVAFRSFRASP